MTSPVRGLLIGIGCLITTLAMSVSAEAATITVDTADADLIADADDGYCALAEALVAANSNAPVDSCDPGSGASDTIEFNIGGAGPYVISQAEPLPSITTPIVIDGTTQPGYVDDPLVKVDGGSAGSTDGFLLTGSSGGSRIAGLVVRNFELDGVLILTDGNTIEDSTLRSNGTNGIEINGNSNVVDRVVASSNGNDGVLISDAGGSGGNSNTVKGSTIGLDGGTGAAAGNGRNGVTIEGAVDGTTIGGTGNPDGNTISGNTLGNNLDESVGVLATNKGTLASPPDPQTNTRILRNLIGTGLNGLEDRGNQTGFLFTDRIEGFEISDNVISGNSAGGIFDRVVADEQPSDGLMTGNVFGLDGQGNDLANQANNVLIFAALNLTIGGTNPGDGNLFTLAGGGESNNPGVAAGLAMVGDRTIDVAILGNRFTNNKTLGIDLLAQGEGLGEPTPNDPLDTDDYPNGAQNHPVIDAAVLDPGAGETTVVGNLHSTPESDFRIEVFSNEAADPSGFGEGLEMLGSFDVTTDDAGDASFVEMLSDFVPDGGDIVTGTATPIKPGGEFGGTSEFGESIVVLDVEDGCDTPSAGDDVLCGTSADDTIDGLDGNDVILGLDGDDTLVGGPGDDTILGGDGTDVADYAPAAAGVDASLTDGAAADDGDGGSDLLDGIEDLTGSDFADLLEGDSGPNEINGLAGDDEISGRGGDDELLGRVGFDTIEGNGGADTVKGDSGNDTLRGNGGADDVRAGSGNDTVLGGDADDLLKGGDGNKDTVKGQNGRDELDGGAGNNDTCKGGPKNDTGGGGCETIKSIP